jgi:hypothetical protein
MLMSYVLEQHGRTRMRQYLREAERARLLAALPRRPGLWARLRARLRPGYARPVLRRARGRAGAPCPHSP